MNAFQRKLRWLIVTGSAVSFLSGWGLLAHAGKPVTTTTNANSVQSQAVVIPSQLPAIDFNSLEANTGTSNSSLQALPSMPAITFSPRLRTAGS
jgi:hypothetical protein